MIINISINKIWSPSWKPPFALLSLSTKRESQANLNFPWCTNAHLGRQGQPHLRWCTKGPPHKCIRGAAAYAGDGSPKLHGRTPGMHEVLQHLNSGALCPRSCSFPPSLSLSLSLSLSALSIPLPLSLSPSPPLARSSFEVAALRPRCGLSFGVVGWIFKDFVVL